MSSLVHSSVCERVQRLDVKSTILVNHLLSNYEFHVFLKQGEKTEHCCFLRDARFDYIQDLELVMDSLVCQGVDIRHEKNSQKIKFMV